MVIVVKTINSRYIVIVGIVTVGNRGIVKLKKKELNRTQHML